ncbi:delta 1-pyrroline-5-carboxylate reductase [Gnomoniopsis sp. IMI 355080]|nr:delta 1-pyrroline-5-carboxylate reductase [Gnomoniopsis sp. IMI 355080]
MEGLLSSSHPWDIVACVRSSITQANLLRRFAASSSVRVALSSSHEQIATHVSPAALVLLATKRDDATSILQNKHVQAALGGKLLISVVFGLTEDAMYSQLDPGSVKPYILSALPNIAASVRHSATITTTRPSSSNPWPEEISNLCSLVLSSIGSIIPVQAHGVNAAATLSGTIPAFLGEAMAGLLGGACDAGLERETATAIVVQGLRGFADLLARGEDVDSIIASVATKGGVTEAGLKVLGEGQLRRLMSDAFMQSRDKLGP